MKNLIQEIHRRSLWQVLGIYLAASWVAIQVVNEIGDAVGLPEWVSGGALVLLVIGFPIVLATAFIQHGPRTRPEAEPEPVPAPEAAGPEAPSPVPARAPEGVSPRRRGHQRLFTWRNALLGGVGAFVLFGAGTGIWMTLRALGIGPAGTLVAKGALEERALVILADFDAEDETLADAATEALRVDLSQSGIIRLAEPSAIADALGRMGRDPTEPLTPQLATELAEREGAGAVITGQINRAGVGHVFSAQVVSMADGAVLTSQRESAADETDVIPAIDRLSKKLRERIGESFRTIRSDPPLERVTTPSLEALKLYSRSTEAGGDRRVALLEQAVALDSGFAMAWRSLGIVYNNRHEERAKMVDAFTRAFESRARLTERERRLMAADYYLLIEFDPERASVEYQALLELDPSDVSATINLGAMYSELGDHARATEYALRGIEVDPESFTGYWNSVTSLVNVGRLDEAQAIVDSAAKVFDAGGPQYAETMVQQARGDLEGVERTWRGFLDQPIPDGFRATLAANLAAVTAARGRLREAEEETRLGTSIHAEAGRVTEYLEAVIQAAWTDLVVREGAEEALSRVDEALARYPLADLEPLDRPYVPLAELVARAGRLAQAASLLEEMRATVDAPRLARYRNDIRRVEAEVVLAEGRAEEAIEAFRRADAGACHICALPGLALAYEAAGQPDSAIAVHQRYIETPYSDRFLPYTYPLGPALGPTYERLGELHDEQGDLENAAKYYAMFVELWAEADAELQPRVRAAQARLEEIVRERG